MLTQTFLPHAPSLQQDVNDIGGVAAQVGPNSTKFRRGVGRKFGEGIQFLTTGIGGLAFAFYSSWRVSQSDERMRVGCWMCIFNMVI